MFESLVIGMDTFKECKGSLMEQTNEIRINEKLLSQAFLHNKNLHLEKILNELKKMKFETAEEIGWITSLIFRLLSEDNNLEKLANHTKKTPSTIMAKFGFPEQIDTSKVENKDLIKINKSLKGIFYLATALFSLDGASKELDENNYDEFVSLTLLSVESFAKYEAEYFEGELSYLKAKMNAHKRHAETYVLKEQAIDYWCKNIDPKLSNPKAADILIKVVPVSHRKLVEYVAEAKRKNILSAS